MRVLLLVVFVWSVIANASAEDASKSSYEAAARASLEALATGQTNVQFLPSLTNLPVSVRDKLKAADVRQPYGDGCIAPIGKRHRRFLLATKNERTYNVAFEQGGLIPQWHTWQFVVDAEGNIIEDTKIKDRWLLITNVPSVSVEGEVVRPICFSWTPGLDLTNAIALAGGFTDFADKKHLQIRHCTRTVERWSYQRAVDAGTNAPKLMRGDVVYVKRKLSWWHTARPDPARACRRDASTICNSSLPSARF